MNRSGYLALVLLSVALLVYLLWPAKAGPGEPVNVLPATAYKTAPKTFTLTSGGRTQRVDGDTVTVNGVALPLAADKANALWLAITALRAAADKVQAQIGDEQLAAYHLDGTRELSAPGVRLRWSLIDSIAYVHISPANQLFLLPGFTAITLDRAAGALHQSQLVSTAGVQQLTINGLLLTPSPDGWIAPIAPQRPPFHQRVAPLLTLLGRLTLDGPDAAPTTLLPIAATITLSSALSAGVGTMATTERTLTLYQQIPGGAGVAAFATLPPQPVPAALMQQFTAVVAEMANDYPFDLDRTLDRGGIKDVIVTRAGAAWFTLERREKKAEAGDTNLDVVWSGGRQPAAPEAMDWLTEAANAVAIKNPEKSATPYAVPAEATVLCFRHDDGRETSFALTATVAQSDRWRGTVATVPPLMHDLAPDRLLDRRLSRRAPERVVKLQRIMHGDAPVQEVYAQDDRRSWSKIFPVAKAADASAIARLARAVCQASADDVRLSTPEDAARFREPVLELALRFSPKDVERTKDDVRLEETAVKDWGLSVIRDGDAWQALDLDDGRVYRLADALIDEWQLPLENALLIPVVPSLVRGFTVKSGIKGTPNSKDAKSEFRCDRDGATWRLTENGVSRAADPVQVRRFLRRLVEARAVRRDSGGGDLLPAEIAATITLDLPGSGENDSAQQTLGIGIAVGDLAPITLTSPTPSLTLPGRLILPEEQAAGLVITSAVLLPADVPASAP